MAVATPPLISSATDGRRYAFRGVSLGVWDVDDAMEPLDIRLYVSMQPVRAPQLCTLYSQH